MTETNVLVVIRLPQIKYIKQSSCVMVASLAVLSDQGQLVVLFLNRDKMDLNAGLGY